MANKMSICGKMTAIEILSYFELIFGLIGIFLSLNGTYKLFKQITVLREIIPLPVEKQKKLDADDLYRDLVVKINDEIKHSNKLFEDEHKNDKIKWMRQIVLGSIFTAISLFLSITSSQLPDNAYSKEIKCRCAHQRNHFHHHCH